MKSANAGRRNIGQAERVQVRADGLRSVPVNSYILPIIFVYVKVETIIR